MHTRWRYPLNRADGSNQNIVRLACLFQITSTFDSHAQKQEFTVITGSISFVRKCIKPLRFTIICTVDQVEGLQARSS